MSTWAKRNPDANRAAWRAWYAANAAKKMAWQAERRRELRDWFHAVKLEHPCVRCGESAPECIQFHHRDPAEKEITVSDAITNGWSKDRILGELAKCEALCANCHLKHHWDERQLK